MKKLEIDSIYLEGKNKVIIESYDKDGYLKITTIKKPFWFDWYSETRFNDGYNVKKEEVQLKLKQIIGI